jgi:hypothetical protein
MERLLLLTVIFLSECESAQHSVRRRIFKENSENDRSKTNDCDYCQVVYE